MCTDSSEYHFCSSLAACNSASTFCFFQIPKLAVKSIIQTILHLCVNPEIFPHKSFRRCVSLRLVSIGGEVGAYDTISLQASLSGFVYIRLISSRPPGDRMMTGPRQRGQVRTYQVQGMSIIEEIFQEHFTDVLMIGNGNNIPLISKKNVKTDRRTLERSTEELLRI